MTEQLLKPKPSPFPWLLAAALTALLVGSLFRAYAQTHVGFFRMFATIGLVLIGYFATRTFYALQEGEALDRLRAVLAQIPQGFDVGNAISTRRPNGRGRAIADLTIIGQRGVHLVAIDVTRPFASDRAVLAAWRRRALELWHVRRACEQRWRADAVVPVGGLLLSLYREPAPEETIEGIPVLSLRQLPEDLPHLDRELGEQPLDPEVRRRLLAALTRPAARGGRP